MMLTNKRHKRARQEGYEAAKQGKPINENPYSMLGFAGQTYAALWDAGYNEFFNKNKGNRE